MRESGGSLRREGELELARAIEIENVAIQGGRMRSLCVDARLAAAKAERTPADGRRFRAPAPLE